MPCLSFNLSAFFCNVGGKLVDVKNSVCNGCYAMKGFYGMYKKQHTVNHIRKMNKFTNTDLWILSFTDYLTNHYKTTSKIDSGYFRWFDSGDIQNYKMLLAIVEICNNTPHIKHWLPTKEYSLIRRYKKEIGKFPKNLCVRVSSPMIDSIMRGFNNTSSVSKTSQTTDTRYTKTCHAAEQDNKCLECRLCWDKSIKNITYKYH
jgi:hypothetical protein